VDSIVVAWGDLRFPGKAADFGVAFSDTLGPFPLTSAWGTGETGNPAQGCDPFVNADDVEGSIVLIVRGGCTYVQKVLNAVAAGAEVAIVYNDDRVPPDDETLVLMTGDCPASECSIPAAFISRASALVFIVEDPFNPMVSIIPIPPVPSDTEASTPEGTFRLDSVYPNPLASRATIHFVLPAAQDVRLAVYDVLGREVAVLVDGVRAAGEQTVAFDASALPSGVYLVRLEADAVRLVERVTVVR
jgi:hypothetical protein